MKAHLEYSDQKSSKFWEIEVDGTSHTVRYGKIGTAGQSKTKEFSSHDEALRAAEKLIASKKKKGYAAVGGEAAEPEAGGPFEVSVETCWERLSQRAFAPESLDALRELVGRLKGATALWVDQPWAELDYEALAASAPIGLAVFTEPVDAEEGLELSAEVLLGDDSELAECGLVFLDEVRCESVSTSPGTVSILAGGLIATEQAMFLHRNSISHVGSHIESAYVETVRGPGMLAVWPNTEWRIVDLGGRVNMLEGAEVAPRRESEDDRGDLRHGIYRSVYKGGEERFTVEYDQGRPVYVCERDEAGTLQFERRYKGEDSILRVFGNVQLHYERKGKKRILRVVDEAGDVRFERTTTCKSIKSAAAFEEAFDAFYANDVFEESAFDFHSLENNFRVVAGYIDAECAGGWKQEEIVRASIVLEDGGGNAAVVIEEPGPHKGRIFVNDHEEGLFSLDCIDEYVGENDLDTDDTAALIMELPFFQNPLADDLSELFRSIDIRPYDDPIEHFDRFKWDR
ncbi:MAG: WGR domain-containing protein [Myxococcota bacterium]